MGQLDQNPLYNDDILDHSTQPRNSSVLSNPDVCGRAINPFCGDEVSLQLSLDETERISDVGVQSIGCTINQASASMLSEIAKGKTITEIKSIDHSFESSMLSCEIMAQDIKHLGILNPLLKIRKYPIRVKCVLLAWSALKQSIENKTTE